MGLFGSKKKKNDKEKTKYVEALYKIANKSQFKSKYKLFENEVARKVLVAQSAWESGYGTSYSAVNRNNIFGFVGYTYKSLKASIEAYAWQLNNGKQKGYKQARKYLKKIKMMLKDMLLDLLIHIVHRLRQWNTQRQY